MATPSSTITSPRSKKRKDRLAKIATGRGVAMPTVRVVPRDDDMRRLLKHPKAGAFRSSGASNWPNDRFTTRRLADGSITLEGGEKQQEGEKPQQHEKPQQSRARGASGGESA